MPIALHPPSGGSAPAPVRIPMAPAGGCARSPRMPRTKKSIKSRAKPKKAALKRKRARRNKGLRRGTRGK